MAASTDVTLIGIFKELLNSENRSGPVVNKFDLSFSLSSGTGSGQADQVWSDRRSLASTSEVLDLAGSLTDSLGNTITWAKIKFIAIKNRNTTATEVLQVGPDSTNGWGAATGGIVVDASDRVEIDAGGFWMWYNPAGNAVTGGSADELFIDAGSNTVSYDIFVVGTTA